MVLTLKNDVIFKAVYGRENEDCKAALISMLNLILDRKKDPIKTITYRNPFNIRETDSQKEGILDIKAEAGSGELLDIEMQLVLDDEIVERNLYYHCGMVTQGLAAGEKYGKLKKTISILLLNFTRSQESQEFHTCFMLREPKTGELLTDLFQLHYIELPKVNPEGRPASELSDVERFLEYLKYAGEPGQETYVEALRRQGGKEIQMADTIMRQVTEDEILQEKAIARDKFLHWQASLARQKKRLQEEIAETKQNLEITNGKLERTNEQLIQKGELLAQKDELLAQKGEQLAQKGEQLIQKEEQLTRKEEQLTQKDKQLKLAIQSMSAAGMDIDQIAGAIGMKAAEAEQYLA